MGNEMVGLVSTRLRSRRPLCRLLQIGCYNLGGLTHMQDTVLHAAAHVCGRHTGWMSCVSKKRNTWGRSTCRRLRVGSWEQHSDWVCHDGNLSDQAPTPTARTAGMVILVRNVLYELSVVNISVNPISLYSTYRLHGSATTWPTCTHEPPDSRLVNDELL